jgi:hypothetical protein
MSKKGHYTVKSEQVSTAKLKKQKAMTLECTAVSIPQGTVLKLGAPPASFHSDICTLP